jgi:hypothetical protein
MNDHLSKSPGRIFHFAAGTIGLALILFVYHLATWQSFTGFIKVCDGLFCDFVIYYYPMGEAIFSTGQPVPGYLYSPFIAILLAGFPPLGLSSSLILWGLLQVLVVFIFVFLFRRLVPAGLTFQLIFAGLVFSSYPLVLNFLGGQVSVFIIVGILGALLFFERSRHVPAAGLLAFVISFKFYPALFFWPFVCRRAVRFVFFAIVACVLFLFMVPGLLLGVEDTLGFYGVQIDSFRDSEWVIKNPHSQFFPHLVLRLIDVAAQDMQTVFPLLHWIAYSIAAINMGLIYAIQRAGLRFANLWSFHLVFLSIPFVLKTSWPHDFIFLPFTQAFLIWFFWEKKKPVREIKTWKNPAQIGTRSQSSSRSGMAAPFLLVLLSIILSNIVFFNLFGDFVGYGFYGMLFWANMLLLVLLYLELFPQSMRKIRRSQIG